MTAATPRATGGVGAVWRRGAPLALLTLAALVPRLVLLLTTIDAPGDGPSRAYAAWEWSRHPSWITSGFWPPGLLYVVGLLNVAGIGPLHAGRAVAVAVGTLTVPAFEALVERTFDRTTGWLAAILLAALPLHVELSASSLSEAAAVFAVVVGMLAIIAAVEDRVDDDRADPALLTAGVVALAWATMSRYETWPLILPVAAYLARRTRPSIALAAIAALIAFPLVWTAGNALATGDPLYGFTMARRGADVEGVAAIGMSAALALLARHAAREVGIVAAIATVIGAVAAMGTLRAASAERRLFLAAAAVAWAGLIASATMRAESLYGRYLVLGIVLALPLACAPFARMARRRRGAAAIACAVAVASLAATASTASLRYVTPDEPVEIRALAEWLRGDAGELRVLMTDLGWHATYLPLYAPEIGPRLQIISAWVSDREIADAFDWFHPDVLVTARDDAQRIRVERALATALVPDAALHRVGSLEIYRFVSLRGSLRGVDSD